MVLLRQRQRKLVASFALGCWLFAFFVAIVHACTLDGELVDSHHVSTGATDHQSQGDHPPTACEQFCADAARLAAKSTLFQDQTGEQALLLAPTSGAPMVPGIAPVASLPDRPHPPLGIALYTRFLRLAL